jgi:hypothetical protein
LATDAGLKQARIRFEHRTARYPDAADFIKGFLLSSPSASAFLALPELMQSRFIGSVKERLAGYIDDGGITIPRENHFLTATR